MTAYYKNKRDTSHKQIAAELRQRGVEVIEILQPLDILAAYRGYVSFIEVKMPKKDAPRFTRRQLDFIAGSRVPMCFAVTSDEAFESLRTQQGLTSRQRQGIERMLLREDKKLFTANDIERAMNE